MARSTSQAAIRRPDVVGRMAASDAGALAGTVGEVTSHILTGRHLEEVDAAPGLERSDQRRYRADETMASGR